MQKWHSAWTQRQLPPVMLPVWIRPPLQETVVTQRPLILSRLALHERHLPVGLQVPPPLSAWPQFRGHGASVMSSNAAEDGAGVVGAVVVGAADGAGVGSEVVGSGVVGAADGAGVGAEVVHSQVWPALVQFPSEQWCVGSQPQR